MNNSETNRRPEDPTPVENQQAETDSVNIHTAPESRRSFDKNWQRIGIGAFVLASAGGIILGQHQEKPESPPSHSDTPSVTTPGKITNIHP